MKKTGRFENAPPFLSEMQIVRGLLFCKLVTLVMGY